MHDLSKMDILLVRKHDIMIAELRQKSQVTIPKKIVAKLGLSEELKEEISDVKAKIASGE